ncbi:RND family transporter [Candidatus Margulisiibacteriota bacterium]
MTQRLINFVVNKPRLTIFLVVLLTLIMASGIPKVTIDDNMVNMMPKDLPSRKMLDRFEDTFGRADFAMLGIGVKKGTIFNFDTLKRVYELTEKIKRIPGIDQVDSITTLKRIQGQPWGLEVKPFMEELPKTQTDIDRLERDIFEDDTFVGTYVSEDKQYTTIIGTTLPGSSEYDIYLALNKLKSEARSPGVDEVFVSGIPILRNFLGESIKNDLQRFLPFVLLVLVFVLYLSIRTMRGVFFTLAVIVLSVLPVAGMMGHLRKPFMMINNAMPVILLAIACADSIHIITCFYKHLSTGLERKAAVKKTMQELILPVFITSITTMAGFLSLLTAPIPKIGEMGLFVAFGVFWAFVLSVTMLPALLTIFKTPQISIRKVSEEGLVHSFLDALAGLTIKHKKYILAVSVLIVLISAVGITKVKIETNSAALLPPESDYRLAAKAADEHFGGAINLSLMLESDIKNPDILNKIAGFQEYLKTLPEVGKSLSIADVVSRINKAINDNDTRYKVIPETREQVAQSLLLYSFSGDPADFARLVDNEYSQTALNVRLASLQTAKMVKLVNKIKGYYETHFPKGAKISATGTAMFITELSTLIVQSSIFSILSALLFIFIINWIAFRSWQIGLFNTFPLGVAVMLNFGLMGLFGIDLSIPLAILSCIAIGVGVDYAVHYSANYQLVSQTVSDPDEKTRAVIHNVGRPILFNAVSVAAGFMVLMISNFIPIKFLGLLVALSMLACALGALTVLASVLNLVNPKA